MKLPDEREAMAAFETFTNEHRFGAQVMYRWLKSRMSQGERECTFCVDGKVNAVKGGTAPCPKCKPPAQGAEGSVGSAWMTHHEKRPVASWTDFSAGFRARDVEVEGLREALEEIRNNSACGSQSCESIASTALSKWGAK